MVTLPDVRVVSVKVSVTVVVLRGEVVSFMPNPQHGGPGAVFRLLEIKQY